jgi:hypothetical protein
VTGCPARGGPQSDVQELHLAADAQRGLAFDCSLACELELDRVALQSETAELRDRPSAPPRLPITVGGQ